DRDLGAGGDVAALLDAAGQAEGALRRGLRLPPAELLRRGLEHGAQARVAEVAEAQVQRVLSEGVGQLVHLALAREVVGGSGQAAVRALPQRVARDVELDL